MTDLLSFDLDSLPFLRTGTTRRVYTLGSDHVVKVAIRNDDAFDDKFCVDANRREVDFFLLAEKEGYSHLLCPIVGWAEDFSWLIMRRATIGGLPSSLTDEEWSELVKVQDQLRPLGMMDCHFWNFGRDNEGRWVALDYAF